MVTNFAKYPAVDSYKTNFHLGINQYRKFRKIYTVNQETSVKPGLIRFILSIINIFYQEMIFSEKKNVSIFAADI